MANFFLSKNFAKPGEIISAQGSCVVGHTEFASSDESIAVVFPPANIHVVGVGTASIYESTPYADCTNGSTGIILTSTEDGNPFFISKEDYISFTNYEGIFVFFILLSAFIFRFAKKS